MDARSEPWTWVMGEAEGDLSYEDMVAAALQREEQEQKRKDEEDAKKAKVRETVCEMSSCVSIRKTSCECF